MTTALESLECRVACLERQNRRLKRGGALLVLAFAAFGLVEQALVGSVSRVWAADREPTEKEVREGNAELAKLKREEPEKYKQIVAGVQAALGAFGFGTGPFDGVLDGKTREAARKYQRIRKLPETGDIDFTTQDRIGRDFDVLLTKPVEIGPGMRMQDDFWDQGYVFARGTLIAVGHEQGNPAQTSEFRCYKDRKICIQATAVVYELGRQLDAEAKLFEIERWDQHELVTKPDELFCVRYTLRFVRATKSVTGVRLRTSDTGPLCKGLEPELEMRLVDGWKAVTWPLMEKRGARLKEVMQAPGLYSP